MEMASDEKSCDLITNEIDKESKVLTKIEKDFKNYLYQKQNNQKKRNKMEYDLIQHIVQQSKQRVTRMTNQIKLNKVNIENNINVEMLIKQISKYFKDNFKIKKYKPNNNNNAHTKQKQVNITQNIENSKHEISWKFDYFYDYKNNGSKIHSIKHNGKKLVCKCNGACSCFYVSYLHGMKPQSG